MRKLLVLADDFTGGLDTGAQFAAAGIPTVVTTNPAYCAADHEEDTVLVVDVETRHLLPEKARQIVEQTIRAAIAHGFTDIYKKTDSALRGNLGAELQGVLDGTGQTRLHLIPAFPEMGRTTKDGVQLIDGVPVAQSVFGKDPFEPVRYSKIREILAEQCTCAVRNVGKHMPQQFVMGRAFTFTTQKPVQMLHASQLSSNGMEPAIFMPGVLDLQRCCRNSWNWTADRRWHRCSKDG